jgi:transcriptional regulator with XRE-family HTH domain
LADLAGIHRTYVAGIERGYRNPSLKNIVRLARALKIKTVDLFKKLDLT